MGILDASSGVVLAAAMAPTALAHSPSQASLDTMALNCGSSGSSSGGGDGGRDEEGSTTLTPLMNRGAGLQPGGKRLG